MSHENTNKNIITTLKDLKYKPKGEITSLKRLQKVRTKDENAKEKQKIP